MNRQGKINQGIDWSLIWLYMALVTIGLISVFIVQYRENDDVMSIILKGSKDYGKQFRWLAVCTFIAIFILLTDSKLFTATANLLYATGILLILITFFFHSSVKGSRSFLGYGSLRLFQPAEFTKIFTTLALAKFLSSGIDFTKQKNHLIASAITLTPAILTILQNETGLALVYFALFLAMYREGLPGIYLVVVAVIGVISVASLLITWYYIIGFLVLSIIGAFMILSGNSRKFKKYFSKVFWMAVLAGLYSIFLLPTVYNNVLKPHHRSRINDLLGIEAPAFAKKSIIEKDKEENEKVKKKKGDSYNVKQSKIAIGSGGFLGKGPLNNTQTRFDFVPEQHTDFIFCSVAEAFGFIGSIVLLILYLILLWRLIVTAERQRSTFSRVYIYGVASILFFHIFVNLSMTLGLAPVIGIPLPYISYGGASLITFTALLFIAIKFDADRQMALR
jgi:rod shape determining protein RodA